MLGSRSCLRKFERALTRTLPPLACIDSMRATPLVESESDAIKTGFAIVPSRSGRMTTRLLPDMATCPACLQELFDPNNRRYHYPFISCTHCGPRFSIIESMPYDRPRTSMSAFQQCDRCQNEYETPGNRRFHAQANACRDCGPKLWLETPSGRVIRHQDPFALICARLQAGHIVALKGVGGFHLCCDASNAAAVRRLRQRKQRPAKALAVMFSDLPQLGGYVELGATEKALLDSPLAPIVLLPPQEGGKQLAEEIAPDSALLGCMLPYTPMHHLLLSRFAAPLVMTSGNRSGMPVVIDNTGARKHLVDIADLLVMHDRSILTPVDDSVMRVRRSSGQIETLRPARGVTPLELPLPAGFDDAAELLALGGDLKNTFCLIGNGYVTQSQYQGDLQQLAVNEAAAAARRHYVQLYQSTPQRLVSDRHPGYISTQEALAERELRVVQVQHHHAHLASCLGEHGYPLDGVPVLGICLDGTGYGEPEGLWGGELLYGSYTQVKRVASLQPCALPGGEAAVREPWRLLVAQLLQAGIDPASTVDIWPWLAQRPVSTLARMIGQGINAPVSSSAGRLFDAMAAALGCYAEGISYEGQAAMALESLVYGKQYDTLTQGYCFPLVRTEGGRLLGTNRLWPQVIADLRKGQPGPVMAMAFHLGLARGLVAAALNIREEYPYRTVVLTGGVMQNSFLSDYLESAFGQAGISVLRHQRVPCNDSGLSVGQALVALARRSRDGEPDA